MNKVKVFLVALIFVCISGCAACIDYPKRLVDDKGVALEPAGCYDYRVCMYYVAAGDYQSDCKLEYTKCCKERNYVFCNNPDNIWADDKPQNCWDKLD